MDPTVKLVFHIILVVLLLAFFIWQFIRNKRAYEFLLMLWIPSTLLVYPLRGNKLGTDILGYAQLALFLAVIILLMINRKKVMKNYMQQLSQQQEKQESNEQQLSGQADPPAEKPGDDAL